MMQYMSSSCYKSLAGSFLHHKWQQNVLLLVFYAKGNLDTLCLDIQKSHRRQWYTSFPPRRRSRRLCWQVLQRWNSCHGAAINSVHDRATGRWRPRKPSGSSVWRNHRLAQKSAQRGYQYIFQLLQRYVVQYSHWYICSYEAFTLRLIRPRFRNTDLQLVSVELTKSWKLPSLPIKRILSLTDIQMNQSCAAKWIPTKGSKSGKKLRAGHKWFLFWFWAWHEIF